MNVMLIFGVIIVIFGVYMVGAALQMKRSGEISSVLLAPEELAKCHDKKGFIDLMYPREAMFGGVCVVVGALGIINEMLAVIGVFNIVRLVVFLAAFVWFQMGLRKARENFL